jgi:hypothetical protein
VSHSEDRAKKRHDGNGYRKLLRPYEPDFVVKAGSIVNSMPITVDLLGIPGSPQRYLFGLQSLLDHSRALRLEVMS